MGYSWGGASNIIAAQRLGDVDAVVSIDGAIKVVYNGVRVETADISAETMDIPFMSVSPPPSHTNAWWAARGYDTTFVFYDNLRSVDAYDITFTRMKNHEDVESVYTRFLNDQQDRNPEAIEAAGASYRLMQQTILQFL